MRFPGRQWCSFLAAAVLCLAHHALGEESAHCKPLLQKRLLAARHADGPRYMTSAGSWIPGMLPWARPSETLNPCFSMAPAAHGQSLAAMVGCLASFQLLLDEQCASRISPANMPTNADAEV